MPSPDLTSYVDLTVYDRDAQEIFDSAVLNAQTRLPDWRPAEGQTEVVVFEGVALQVSEAVFAINRLPGAVLEILLRLFDVQRFQGSAPQARIRFTVSTVGGVTVPAGTRVRLSLGEGRTPVDFATSTELTILPGQVTGVVDAVGERLTEEANGAPAGTVVGLLDALAFLERAQLDAEVQGGRSAETDEEWLARGVAVFSTLNETLVRAEQFATYAISNAGEVYRARAIDNYDPARGGSPGAHAGFVTVAVYGENSGVPAVVRSRLAEEMAERAHTALQVRIVEPTLTAINADVTVAVAGTNSADAVRARVDAALRRYLSPTEWGWSQTVYRNELIALVSNVEGVDRVVALTAPDVDLALPGVAALTSPGQIVVRTQ